MLLNLSMIICCLFFGKGDLAIVHSQNSIDNGKTALIYIPDDEVITIKKVIKNDDGFELYSMNPNVPIDRKSNIIILGRVIKSHSENAYD